MYDAVVKKFAPLTCIRLENEVSLSMIFYGWLYFVFLYGCYVVFFFKLLTYLQKGSSNIYPHELEELLGDPILFKVKKDCGSDSSGTIVVEVLDFLIDSNVMEIYLNPSHDAYSYNVGFIVHVYIFRYINIYSWF
jgi:hypothetical protein